MRKLSFVLSLIMLLSCFSLSAFAVEDTDTVCWNAEIEMTKSSGYPRMAQRADGTLLLTTDAGEGFISTDEGQTFTKLSERIVTNASTSAKYTKDGTEYTFSGMTRANFQPFVLEDGTVFLGYRFHTNTGATGYTKGDPFYTSIRVMTSTDGGLTYNKGSEEILVEDVNLIPDNNGGTGHGFWEPFFLQIDENTIACYYADDLNVHKTGTNNNKHAQQRIAYVTYDIPTKTWDKTVHTAIYRGGPDGMSTRDGMPMATTLSDGTFAMVVEAQDYSSWLGAGTNSTFVVGLSLSKDGREWTEPVPVLGPDDLSAGILCAAPSIATLPDGRVVITCASDEGYVGQYGNLDKNDSGDAGTYGRILRAAISDAPLTNNTVLTRTTGGAAEGFTVLEDVFVSVEDGYQIWNAVSCFGDDLYLYGTAGIVTGMKTNGDTIRTGGKIRIRPAKVFTSANAKASYDAALTRVGNLKYDYIIAEPHFGATTVTIESPAALSSAENFFVYELNGDFVTLKGSAAVGSNITFTASEKANYIVAEDEIITYGDATGDGEVNLKDVIRVIKQIISPVEGTDVAASDVNSSLSIDINDVMSIIKKILN